MHLRRVVLEVMSTVNPKHEQQFTYADRRARVRDDRQTKDVSSDRCI